MPEFNKKMIDDDIKKIDDAIQSFDLAYIMSVHMDIDGKYQVCIKDWMKGLKCYHMDHGIIYGNLDIDSMKRNLCVMRPKLIAFKEGWNVNHEYCSDKTDINVVENNNNNVNVDVSFENARREIENMQGLTQKETEEIQTKIDELKGILDENLSKKKKWERIKPIISFALDKGVDVALVIINLVIQLKTRL